MGTKIILHGGNACIPNEQNDRFFQEILKGTSSNPKILLVYFATDEAKYPIKKGEDVAQFERNNLESRGLNFKVANKRNFTSQVEWADVIYLHGGKTFTLFSALLDYCVDFKEAIKGKIVAGESAGSYVLSSYSYSKSVEAETGTGLFEGMGLAPVKTICHYEGRNAEKLDAVDLNLHKLLLPDFEFEVFELP